MLTLAFEWGNLFSELYTDHFLQSVVCIKLCCSLNQLSWRTFSVFRFFFNFIFCFYSPKSYTWPIFFYFFLFYHCCVMLLSLASLWGEKEGLQVSTSPPISSICLLQQPAAWPRHRSIPKLILGPTVSGMEKSGSACHIIIVIES